MAVIRIGDRVKWSCYDRDYFGVVSFIADRDLPKVYMKKGDVIVWCDGDNFGVAVDPRVVRKV